MDLHQTEHVFVQNPVLRQHVNLRHRRHVRIVVQDHLRRTIHTEPALLLKVVIATQHHQEVAAVAALIIRLAAAVVVHPEVLPAVAVEVVAAVVVLPADVADNDLIFLSDNRQKTA